MITNEMIEFESGKPSAKEASWMAFANECEKLSGKSLDGDLAKDGFALDHAYEKWEQGWSAGAYAQWHMKDKPKYRGLDSACPPIW